MLPRYASSFCRRIRFGLCRRWLRHPRSAQFMVQPKKQFLISLDNNQKDNFDLSDYQAWQSGSGLRNLLTLLNGEYPGHVYLLGHSMGNVTVGEALRLSSHATGKYIRFQPAALSAHTYDGTIPNYSFFFSGIYPPQIPVTFTPTGSPGSMATPQVLSSAFITPMITRYSDLCGSLTNSLSRIRLFGKDT